MELKPVVPFEPVSAETPPTGSNWTAQVKWDGVRILTYFDGSEVRLYNRKLNERTLQYPELTVIEKYCSASSVILDGEVIALEKGKPSFHSVMKRDGVRQTDKVPRAVKETPVVYMIFDILFCDGKWVIDQPLEARLDIMGRVIRLQDNIQLVECFDEAKPLLDVVKAQDLEGIVCKDLTSKYALKGKDQRWQKLKNYHDLIAVVGGVTLRGNLVNSLLLGQYDSDGRLWYIGHAGTGKLSMTEWRALSEHIGPLVIKGRPFVNKPERMKTAVWLKPVITVKIRYIEWTEGNTLRQPSIQAFADTPPEDCCLEGGQLFEQGSGISRQKGSSDELG